MKLEEITMGVSTRHVSFFVLLALSASSNVVASKSDVYILEKVYKLDAVKSSGVCPSDLKNIFRATKKDFDCDRVRIDFGYRSKELVQCKLRTDLANKIIQEYNTFMDQCRDKNID